MGNAASLVLAAVVGGVFALLVLATWTQRLFGLEHRLNALVAGAVDLGQEFLTALRARCTETLLANFLPKLRFLVCIDWRWNTSALYSDVVLPASAHAEKTGTFTNTDRRVQLGRQAVDPPGEARQDLWIIQQIAQRIGLPWRYDGEIDLMISFNPSEAAVAIANGLLQPSARA